MLAVVCQIALASMTIVCSAPLPEHLAEAFAMSVEGIPGTSAPEIIRQDDPLWADALDHSVDADGDYEEGERT